MRRSWSVHLERQIAGGLPTCHLLDPTGRCLRWRTQLTESAAIRVVLNWARESLTGDDRAAAEAVLLEALGTLPTPTVDTATAFAAWPEYRDVRDGEGDPAISTFGGRT